MSTNNTQLDWREGRRRRAWELKQQGWKQTAIAAALGITPGAVSQWLKRAREDGVDALRRHPAWLRERWPALEKKPPTKDVPSSG